MNKKTLNLVIWATWIALLALMIQIIDQLIGTKMPIGHTGAWIAFQSWAVYFLGGCTPKGGFKGFISYVVGITTGIVIFELAGILSFAGAFWCVPIAIFIPVIPVMCFEKIPVLDYIPAIFIGCGAFFGIMNYVPDATYAGAAAYELIFCALGLIFGWIAITGKGIIDKRIPVKK
ncbi:uncharacterized protein DUF1097 [Lachnotalea glycerini]|uniref:DUF1097 domain-containing protein n=1 Tax=Lachnotalea glycerini TaxID=1763509 RepID=A0A255I6P9_9FIRM|nr:DUF1097 domain-containing protein [Lachnotalea glycerini]PXV86855.1 uncharacterized protein DUF1097 [Lachnotalea glycerini]RDY30655.1 DUF1097 domain-containing protein [Lachnotalea glycerini]